MLPLSRRIAVSANVVFSLYPTRNKVYLILSYLILWYQICSFSENWYLSTLKFLKRDNITEETVSSDYEMTGAYMH